MTKSAYRFTRGDPSALSALRFAAIAHDGQRREGHPLPYIDHVIAVVERVGQFDETTQIIAALHDVVEDTPFTSVDIDEEFGTYVAASVMQLTLPAHCRGNPEMKRDHQVGMMALMDYRGVAVKIADKTANLHSLVYTPPNWGRKAMAAYARAAQAVVDATPYTLLTQHIQIRQLIAEFEAAYLEVEEALAP